MRAHDRNRMLRVKEGAELLGGSPNTVRAWGAAGKIPEYRHPANGYQLHRREGFIAVYLGEGRNGMVRYLREEVLAYEESRRIRLVP